MPERVPFDVISPQAEYAFGGYCVICGVWDNRSDDHTNSTDHRKKLASNVRSHCVQHLAWWKGTMAWWADRSHSTCTPGRPVARQRH